MAQLSDIQLIRTLDRHSLEETGSLLDQVTSLLRHESDDTTINNSSNRHNDANQLSTLPPSVEETCLRWLLKSMSGTSTHAESMRLSAQSWRLLNRLASTIPLFSLAKSLADRRFVTILQQTLQNLATIIVALRPQQQQQPKQSIQLQAAPFQHEKLKTIENCFVTTENLIHTLQTLLRRAIGRVTSSGTLREKMGAEHIQSLLALPAGDLVKTIANLLQIAHVSLLLDIAPTSSTTLTTQPEWISIVSTLWDMRQKLSTDYSEVVTYLSRPALVLLHLLRTQTQNHATITPETNTKTSLYEANGHPEETVHAAWTHQLRIFLHRNLLLPTRTAFQNHNDRGAITMFAVLAQFQASACYPLYYQLAATLPGAKNEVARTDTAFLEAVFDILLSSLEEADNETGNLDEKVKQLVIVELLELAQLSGCSVRRETLRSICEKHASLSSDGTSVQWGILARSLSCDRHLIFYHSNSGNSSTETPAQEEKRGNKETDDAFVTHILMQITPNSLHELRDLPESTEKDMQWVLREISQSYAETRDLITFWKLWFEQLCLCVDRNLFDDPTRLPVWAQPSFRTDQEFTKSLKTLFKEAQIASFLTWLVSQNIQKYAGPAHLLVQLIILHFSSGILLKSTESRSHIQTILLVDLVSESRQPSLFRELRWNALTQFTELEADIIGTVEEKENDDNVFQIVLKSLPKFPFLKEKHPLDELVKLAIFHFLYTAWDTMSVEEDPFLQTKAKEFILEFLQHLETSSKKSDIRTLLPYIDYTTLHTPRMLPLFFQSQNRLPMFLEKFMRPGPDASMEEVELAKSLWTRILHTNQVLAYHQLASYLVDQLFSLLFASYASNGFQTLSLAVSTLIGRLPDELLEKEHRRKLMSFLVREVVGNEKSVAKLNLTAWKQILALMTKLMRQSTFYEGICFNDYITIADVLSQVFVLVPSQLDGRMESKEKKNEKSKKAKTKPNADAQQPSTNESLGSSSASGSTTGISLVEVLATTGLASELFSAVLTLMKLHAKSWGQQFFMDALNFVTALSKSKTSSSFDLPSSSLGSQGHLRLLLVKEVVEVVSSSATEKAQTIPIDFDDLEKAVISVVKPVFKRLSKLDDYESINAEIKRYPILPYWLLTSITLTEALSKSSGYSVLRKRFEALAEVSNYWIHRNSLLGWKLRAVLLRFGKNGVEEYPTDFSLIPTESSDGQKLENSDAGCESNKTLRKNDRKKRKRETTDSDASNDSSLLFASHLNIATVEPTSIVQSFIDSLLRDIKPIDQVKYLSSSASSLHFSFKTASADDAPKGHPTTALPLSNLAIVALQRVAETICQGSTESFQNTQIDLAYSHIVEKALEAPTGPVFSRFCYILETLIHRHSLYLTTWNAEQTLHLVSRVTSTPSIPSSSSTTVKKGVQFPEMCTHDASTVYASLCKLTEALIKRNRPRLDGRFHLVISTVQSLLTVLLRHPYRSKTGGWSTTPTPIAPAVLALLHGANHESDETVTAEYPLWASDAWRLSRVVSQICDPSTVSYHHNSGNATNLGSLDTARDIVRRSAGRYVYLILSTYTQLLLDVEVPHFVRSKLEPIVDVILEITSAETRRILNDGLDVNARAVLRTEYQRYEKFSRWRGI